MSSFFELFSPGLRFQREQKDLEKMLIMETPTTGKGPVQVDLDKGTIHIRRGAHAAPTPQAPRADADVEPTAGNPDETR